MDVVLLDVFFRSLFIFTPCWMGAVTFGKWRFFIGEVCMFSGGYLFYVRVTIVYSGTFSGGPVFWRVSMDAVTSRV